MKRRKDLVAKKKSRRNKGYDYKGVYSKLFASETDYIDIHPELHRYKMVYKELQKLNNVKTLIDVGCGEGSLIRGLQVKFPDMTISSADLDNFHNIEGVEFKAINLAEKETLFTVDEPFDLLTCLDVLEHIEQRGIIDIIEWFSVISKKQILTIANHSSVHNGEQLHKICKDMDWWTPRIEKHLNILDVDYDTVNLYILKTESK